MDRQSQNNRLPGYSVLAILVLFGLGSFLVSTNHSQAFSQLSQGTANGRIAFISDGVLYTINANGTDRLQLTSDGTNHSPAWVPDGSAIAFMRQGPQETSNAIYVVNADGSGLLKSARQGQSTRSCVVTRRNQNRFVSGNNDAEIFVMNADGSNRIDLTNNPG
jgi:Tol biopolymer transport system component